MTCNSMHHNDVEFHFPSDLSTTWISQSEQDTPDTKAASSMAPTIPVSPTVISSNMFVPTEMYLKIEDSVKRFRVSVRRGERVRERERFFHPVLCGSFGRDFLFLLSSSRTWKESSKNFLVLSNRSNCFQICNPLNSEKKKSLSQSSHQIVDRDPLQTKDAPVLDILPPSPFSQEMLCKSLPRGRHERGTKCTKQVTPTCWLGHRMPL